MLSAGPEISEAHETGNPEFAAVEKDPESLEEIPVRVRHRIGFGRLVEMFPAMHRKSLSGCFFCTSAWHLYFRPHHRHVT